MPLTVQILLLAVAIDLAIGDPPNAFHPTAWMGQVILFGKYHAPTTGRRAQIAYGAALVLFGSALFAVLVYWLLNNLRARNELVFVVASAIILKTTFTLRGLAHAAREVQTALTAGDLVQARHRVARHLVSRETRALDQSHIVSATVESVAENLADSIVAPLMFFGLFGVPGALVYRFVNTADAIIGYHGATEYLGKCAARLDDFFNFIPSRVTGLFIIIAALFSQADARAAWRVMRRDHACAASPNAGYPMSAMAGALGVQLEKIAYYRLGDAVHALEPTLIPRSMRVTGIAALLWFILLTSFTWLFNVK